MVIAICNNLRSNRAIPFNLHDSQRKAQSSTVRTADVLLIDHISTEGWYMILQSSGIF